MRLSMLPLVALAAVPATPDADACGYVMPTVFLVSAHDFRADHASHALVRLHDAAPAGLAWEQAQPMSYDSTEIAPAPQLAHPMTFTLVGTAGAQVVTSALQRFIAHDMWSDDAPATAAVDIGRVDPSFRIALAGTHHDAVFHELRTGRDGTARIELADYGIIEATTDFSTHYTTTLSRDGRSMGRFDGTVAGELETGGLHYIIIADHGNARAVAIW